MFIIDVWEHKVCIWLIKLFQKNKELLVINFYVCNINSMLGDHYRARVSEQFVYLLAISRQEYVTFKEIMLALFLIAEA
jgi:hypothetical protein